MGKKRREQEQQSREQKRKKRIRLAIQVGVVACLCGIFVVSLYLMSFPSTIQGNLVDGDLVIPVSKVTSSISYVQYGGTQEIMVKKVGNQYLTGFDTCESCFELKGRYTENDDTLVCSSCQNTYPSSYLGMNGWGDCQPIAIPVEYRADTDTDIVIPAAVLQYSEEMFDAWSAGDYSVTLEYYPL